MWGIPPPPISNIESLQQQQKQIGSGDKSVQVQPSINVENLLLYIPIHSREKANRLFRFLLQHNVKWSSTGQFLESGNIIDLVLYAISTLPSKHQPPALDKFIQLLKPFHPH